MRLADIVEKYCIDEAAFVRFVRQSGIPYSDTHMGFEISDSYVNDYVEAFWEYNEQLEEERKAELEEEENRRRETAHMLISSGFSFDGYKIVKYSGYISGDDAARVENTWILSSDKKITDKITGLLVRLRRTALQELKEAAYDLGCNAVVGVDFDYLTLEPEKISLTSNADIKAVYIAVTANGNAVLIEKEDD